MEAFFCILDGLSKLIHLAPSLSARDSFGLRNLPRWLTRLSFTLTAGSGICPSSSSSSSPLVFTFFVELYRLAIVAAGNRALEENLIFFVP